MNRWSETQALRWQEAQPWLVGCNYVPRSAVNQLEMWQAETFALPQIEEELGWASAIGINSIRIFLHDLAWRADPRGFIDRLDQVLAAAQRHKIGALIVFFDSVWHPFPRAGTQRSPEPHVHNSGWVQSPGVTILRDPQKFEALAGYVTSVVSHFADDPRIHGWDLWNEPDNTNTPSYGSRDLGAQKAELIVKFLPQVYAWARRGNPSQPLTSGVWLGDWQSDQTLAAHERIQLEHSDVVSFHCYGKPDELEKRILQLSRYGRPLICSEFMARGVGSTFEGSLPILKKHHVAAYCWGLVSGKSQTIYPWDSWQNEYAAEPELWFHDIFRADGTPYRSAEVECIRTLAANQG